MKKNKKAKNVFSATISAPITRKAAAIIKGRKTVFASSANALCKTAKPAKNGIQK